jgi:hypothetical protein
MHDFRSSYRSCYPSGVTLSFVFNKFILARIRHPQRELTFIESQTSQNYKVIGRFPVLLEFARWDRNQSSEQRNLRAREPTGADNAAHWSPIIH